MTPEKLYKDKEFAELVGLTVDQLRAWRKRNEGPPVTYIGKSVFYTVSGWQTYIARQTHDPERDLRRRR